MSGYAADLADIRLAAGRIEGHVHRTPVVTSSSLDSLAGRHLLFKCEQLQRTGSFKLRGALNAVLALPEDEATRGVVTHSSGNFAQALAFAARLRGVPAFLVMPRTAPEVKRRATLAYGGVVVSCEPTLEDRERQAARVRRETGAMMIHPFDHPPTIAGQGTVALEFLAQAGPLDALVAPIGGGGLIAGLALAVRELAPGLRVLAAEPSGADDAARSKAAGRLIPQTGPRTVCDGLRTSLGGHTWPVVRDLVERVVTVDDAAVVAALRLVWERMKLVIEPSAAAAVAVALGKEVGRLEGIHRLGVVLSGGNVDFDGLAQMTTAQGPASRRPGRT